MNTRSSYFNLFLAVGYLAFYHVYQQLHMRDLIQLFLDSQSLQLIAAMAWLVIASHFLRLLRLQRAVKTMDAQEMVSTKILLTF